MNIRVSICAFLIVLFYAFLSYGEEVKGNKSDNGKNAVQKSDKNMQGKPDKKEKSKESVPTLIVFEMTPEKGIEKGVTNLLVELIMSEVGKTGRFEVIGQKDIDKMLFWETNKQIKNCNESSCMMQIAGAMGAEYYVESSIGVVGNKYLISMKLIETMQVKIKGRSTRTIDKNEDKLIEEVRDMVKEMLTGAGMWAENVSKDVIKPEVIKGRVEGESDKKWIGYTLIGGGILIGALGGYFTYEAKVADDKYRDSKSADEANKYDRERSDNNTRAVIMYGVGGGVMLIGAGYLIWNSYGGEKREDNKNKVGIDFGINYVGINGRF